MNAHGLVSLFILLSLVEPCFPVRAQDTGVPPQRSVDREHEVWLPEDGAASYPVFNMSPASTQFLMYKVNQFQTNEPQNEPSVRIQTKSRNRIVAAYRDFRMGSNPAIRNVGIASTADGGLTWNERLFSYRDSAIHREHNRYSDPSVGVDTAGNFYVLTLSYSTTDPSSVGNALSFMKSTDGGATWFSIAPAIERVPDVFEDREILYVDDGPSSRYSGNIYVSWTRFPNSGGPTYIYCARSTNGGASFEPPVRVSDNGNVQHSMPTTGPDGEVYVAWANSSSIRVDVSTDGGATFGTDHIISTPATAPFWFGTIKANVTGGLSVSGYPSLAIDKSNGPNRGTVYAVWMTRLPGDCDIVCSKSTDLGTTWSTPVRVNDDVAGNGRDQFFSWIAVDEQGNVNVVFLDRRHDPNNILCDAYFAQSRNAGASFENYRVTPQSFDPSINYNADTRFGDYVGIDARLGRIIPIFTATLSDNQDVYIAVIDTVHTNAAPSVGESVPARFTLPQNYPNPFNPSTRIDYTVPQATEVRIDVYDVLGQQVATLVQEFQRQGSYSVTFNGRDSAGRQLPSGTYLCVLHSPFVRQTMKMLLLK